MTNTVQTRPSVLFVDDEPDLLAGLRLSLRGERARWDLAFAAGGDAGLALLANRRFDVVVSDMRMPGMDGATFLGRVRAMHPESVRIVLSGQADELMALRAIPVSHRWLTKPCDRDQIVEVLEQAVLSRRFLHNPKLRELLGDGAAVPSLPHLYDDLMQRIARPDFGLGEIAEVVNRDPAMAARVLQLANSALFRRAAPLQSLTDAVTMLGLRTLSHLLLAAEVFVTLRQRSGNHGELCVAIERRALAMSRVAGSVFGDDPDTAVQASTAGLLHEVGALLLLQHDPVRYRAAQDLARARCLEPDVAESELFGTNHAEVGAALLCTWGLPMECIDVLAHHHRPERWRNGADVAAALRLAEVLASAPWLEGSVATGDARVRGVWLQTAREAVRS